MTFRIGAVGVGAWSQKLATAFRECGAEVVCYDRERRDDYPVWLAHDVNDGKHIPFGSWQNQVSDPDIDALIICAPPDITTEVALACAKVGKRCVATKPLMLTEAPEDAEGWPLGWHNERTEEMYVDLWRLYSPAWLAMREELRGKKIERIDVAFCGNGPFRSFNGALDYGPHALAFVYDLLGTTEIDGLETEVIVDTKRDDGGHLYEVAVKFACGGVTVELEIGNGAAEGVRRVYAETDDGWHEFYEPDGKQYYCAGPSYPIQTEDEASCSKAYALRRFCRAFIASEPSRTLEYSIAAQRVLERIGTGRF